MERERLATLLEVRVVAALVLAIGSILLGPPLLTSIVVILVILGLIGLMPAMRYPIFAESQARG